MPQFVNISFAASWGFECGAGCLYDVLADPLEYIDLATQQPAALAVMHARLAELNQVPQPPLAGQYMPR